MLKADLQSVLCAPDPDAPCWGAAPFLASPAPGLPILVPPAPATKLNLRKNVDLKLRLQPKKVWLRLRTAAPLHVKKIIK